MKLPGFGEIAAINFEPIKRKLMQEKEWDHDRVATAERQYRRFLFVARQFPGESLMPSADVDAFWHHHILDTAKYAMDCQDVFGYFLHHDPYVGLDGPDAGASRLELVSRSRALYERTFGHSVDGLEMPESKHVYCAVTGANHGQVYCAVHGPRVSSWARIGSSNQSSAHWAPN
jgi:hypothetical protein